MHITWACIESAQYLSHFVHLVSHAPHGSSLSLVTCHPYTCAFLLEFTSLFLYFDLSFPVFFFSFPLLHFELHTELDNLIVMQNLRNSANKGSNDAYDVHTFLTGKVLWENSLEVRLGEGFHLGMLIGTPWKRVFLSVYVDDIKFAGKKQKLNPMWKVLNWEVDLGETSFLDHENLGCTQRQCQASKDILDKLQNHVRFSNFRGGNWKNYHSLKYSYFFVVLRYGRSCQEMSRTILWFGKQGDSTTLQSIYSMHRWPAFQRKLEIRGRIVKSMFSNCSEMCISGRYWTTWYSTFSEPTCTIDYKMDQGLWQTIESFDILHPSYMWYKQYCYVGTLPSNADWDCFKTLTSREILKIHNPLLEEHCAFLEVIDLFPKFGTELEIMSLDIGLRLDGLLALELWDLNVAVFGKRLSCFRSIGASRQEAWLYVFEKKKKKNAAVIKMIIKGRRPTMTCFQNPKSCSWLVVW